MNNGYKIFKAISNTDDSIIADAMNAQNPAAPRIGVISAVAAAAAVTVIVPAVIAASRRPETPPAPDTENMTAQTTGQHVSSGETDDKRPLDFVPVEYVLKHEDKAVESMREEEPFSFILPSKIIPGMVQTLGVKALYDEKADIGLIPLDKDPVGYRAEFHYDLRGIFTDDMKDITDQSYEAFKKRLETHTNVMVITVGKLEELLYRKDYKSDGEGGIDIISVPTDIIPGVNAFYPEQVTLDMIESRLSDQSISLNIIEGDFYISYSFTCLYGTGCPSAEEFYGMISSAPAFGK